MRIAHKVKPSDLCNYLDEHLARIHTLQANIYGDPPTPAGRHFAHPRHPLFHLPFTRVRQQVLPVSETVKASAMPSEFGTLIGPFPTVRSSLDNAPHPAYRSVGRKEN